MRRPLAAAVLGTALGLSGPALPQEYDVPPPPPPKEIPQEQKGPAVVHPDDREHRREHRDSEAERQRREADERAITEGARQSREQSQQRLKGVLGRPDVMVPKTEEDPNFTPRRSKPSDSNALRERIRRLGRAIEGAKPTPAPAPSSPKLAKPAPGPVAPGGTGTKVATPVVTDLQGGLALIAQLRKAAESDLEGILGGPAKAVPGEDYGGLLVETGRLIGEDVGIAEDDEEAATEEEAGAPPPEEKTPGEKDGEKTTEGDTGGPKIATGKEEEPPPTTRERDKKKDDGPPPDDGPKVAHPPEGGSTPPPDHPPPPPPKKPDAIDDAVTTKKNTMVRDSVLGNDTYTGSARTRLVRPPSRGHVELHANGWFSYRPARKFVGSDSFAYELRDRNGRDSAVVAIEVKNKKPVAVADFVGTEKNRSVGGNVKANDDEGDGGLQVSLAQRPRHGQVVLRGNGSFIYAPQRGFVGDDGFSYIIEDMDGDKDGSGVSIAVREEPRRRPPPPPPWTGKKACADALRAQNVDPAAAGLKDAADRQAERAYGAALAEFAPGDRSQRRLEQDQAGLTRTLAETGFVGGVAQERAALSEGIALRTPPAASPLVADPRIANRAKLGPVPPLLADRVSPADAERRKEGMTAAEKDARTLSALEGIDWTAVDPAKTIAYEDALVRVQESDLARRKVADAIVATPDETFRDLILASRRAPDAVPVHPLLDGVDLPGALTLFRALGDEKFRAEIKGAARSIDGKGLADKTQHLDLERLRDRLSGALALRGGISSEDPFQLRRRLIGEEGLPGAADLVKRVAAALPLLDSLDKLRKEAGDVPAERLDAAAAQVLLAEVAGKERLVAAREIGTPDVHRTVGISSDGKGQAMREIALDNALDMVELQPIAPLDPKRIEFHRKNLAEARTLGAKAEITVLRSRQAGEMDHAYADVGLSTERIHRAALATGDAGVIRAAAELPVYRKAMDSLHGERLRLKTAGGDTAKVDAEIGIIGGRFQERLASLGAKAAGSRALGQALTDYVVATNVYSDRNREAATRAFPSRADAGEYVEQLQVKALRSGALAMPAAGLATPAAPSAIPSPAWGIVHKKEDLENPAYLENLIRERTAGFGWVNTFESPEKLRDYAQARVGGLGIVHTRRDLADPDYYAKQFQARVGGLGWTHEFNSPEEIRDFAQSRLGGWGMVHLKSDLEDPEYMARLFEQRMGGFGVVHRFKSAEEYRDFVNSRLGGWGRAYTCLDLIQSGMSAEKAEQLFDNAARYAKLPFENDQDYQARMLATYPDEFKQLPDGRIVRKSWQEMQDDMRERKLASGDYVINPRTGDLVHKGTKVGRQIAEDARNLAPRTIRLTFEDGRSATFTISGTRSFRDAIEDALAGKGYTSDGAGNWFDADGNRVLSAGKLDGWDRQYVQAMDQRMQGFSTFLSYRPEEQRPTGPPPPLGQQLATLERDIVAGMGYEIRNLDLGPASLASLQVRPGETVTDALRRTLEGTPLAFDDNGNLIDTRTGAIAMSHAELDGLDRKYRGKVVEAVFGEGERGINREVLWLAQHGTPEQQREAGAIIADINGRLGALKQAEAAQWELRQEMDRIRDDPGLSESERGQRLRVLQRQMDDLTRNRSDIETGLARGVQEANASAARVVRRDLTLTERSLVDQNDRMLDLAARIQEIDRRLEDDVPPSERRRLERQRHDLQKDLYQANQEFVETAGKLPAGTNVGALVEPIDLRSFNIDQATVANPDEARRRAAWAEQVDGQWVYRDAAGNVLRDLDGNPVTMSPRDAARFREQVVNGLARRADNYLRTLQEYDGAKADHNDAVRRIAALEGKNRLSHSERQELERLQALRDRRAGRMRELAPDLASFAGQLDRLDDESRGLVERRAVAIAAEKERLDQEWRDGRRAITYMDENGEWQTWNSPAQKARMAELQRIEEERQRRIAEQRARAEAETTRRAREEEARRVAEEQRRWQGEQDRRRQEATDRQQRHDGVMNRERSEQARIEDEVARARTRYLAARERAGDRSTGTYDADMAELRAAETALQDAEGRLAARQARTREVMALSAVNDDGSLSARLEQQRRRIGEAEVTARTRAADADLARLAWQDAQRRLGEGRATPQEVDRLHDLYRLKQQESQQAQGTIYAERNGLDAMVDYSLYGGASREFNAARLSELQAKVSASGETALRALSPDEYAEYGRRQNLQRYHDRVASAQASASRLAQVTARFREAPGSLTEEERGILYRGLNDEEISLLVGDTQRRGMASSLLGLDDQQGANFLRGQIDSWMTGSDGALSGRLLHNQDRADVQRLFGFMSTEDVYRTEVEARARNLDRRREELADWRRQYEANRNGSDAAYYLDQLHRSEELVRLGENLLGYSQDQLAREEQRIAGLPGRPAGAVGNGLNLGGLTVTREDGFIEHSVASLEGQRREAETRERERLGNEAEMLQRYRQGRDQVMAREQELAENRAMHQRHYDDYGRRIEQLQAEQQYFRTGLEDETLEEDFAERRIREVASEIEDLRVQQRTYGNFLASLPGKHAEQLAELRDRVIPESWEMSGGARSAENQFRMAEMIEQNRLIREREDARDSALGEMQARVDRVQDRLDRARRTPGAEHTIEQLEIDLASANEAYSARQQTFIRQLRTLENERRDMMARNGQDGVGPASDYSLSRYAETNDIDLDVIYRTPDQLLAQQREGAGRMVDNAIRADWAAPQRSLASLFAEGVAEEAVDFATSPTRQIKTVVGSWYGAGRAVVTGIYDTVDIIGEAAAINLGFEDGGIFGNDKINGIATLVDNWDHIRVSQLVDAGLREMGKGDVVWNSAVFGGGVAADILLTLENPGLALQRAATTSGRVLTRTSTVLRGLAEAAETAGEAGRLARFTERAAAGTAEVLETAGRALRVGGVKINEMRATFSAAREWVNTSRAGRVVNEGVPALADAVARRTLPRFLYDPDAPSVPDLNLALKMDAALRHADGLMEEAGGVRDLGRRASLIGEAGRVRQEVADAALGNSRAAGLLGAANQERIISTLGRNFPAPGATARVGVDASGNVTRAASRLAEMRNPLPEGMRRLSLPEDPVAAGLARARGQAIEQAVERHISEAVRGEGAANSLGTLRRRFDQAAVPPETVSHAAERLLPDLDARRRTAFDHVQTLEREAARAAPGDALPGERLDDARRQLEQATAGRDMARALRDQPATPRAAPAEIEGRPAVVGEPEVRRFTPTELAEARRAPTHARRAEQPFTQPAMPEPRYPAHAPLLRQDSRAAEQLAAKLEGEAGELARRGAPAEEIAAARRTAERARGEAAATRRQDFRRTLGETPPDGQGRRLTERLFPDGVRRPDGTLLRRADDLSAVCGSPEVREAMADFLDRTPDWAGMARTLPDHEPDLAARAMAFREWVFEQVEKKFPSARRTGSGGKMTNDLDFSIRSDTPGRDQIAIERFLREEIEIGPGRRGLGNDWQGKLNSSVFSDPSLIHIYDRLPRSGDVAAVRHGLFDYVEGVEMDALRHAMPEDAWQSFGRRMGLDVDGLAARHPIDPRLGREQLLGELDQALAGLRKADFNDPVLADRVSRLQIEINRRTPDAYVSPGGVRATVTDREGLAAFERGLTAHVRDGRVVLGEAVNNPGIGRLEVRLPSGRVPEQPMTSIGDLRRFLGRLKNEPPTIQNIADRRVLTETLDLVERNMTGLDPVERYQSVLGDIASFEHQLAEAGGDSLEALRRYQTSKYANRVLRQAYEMDMDTRAASRIGEAQRLTREFYQERAGSITRYFASGGRALGPDEVTALQRRADALVEEFRSLHADIARQARTDARRAMFMSDSSPEVPLSENPARFLRQTYGPEGAQAVEAFRMVHASLGNELAGIGGSFARGEARLWPWPEEVASFDEALKLTKLDPDMYTPGQIARLPAETQRLLEVRRRMGRLPSDMDVATPVDDAERLLEIQRRVFKETGVMIEFVAPHGPAVPPLRTLAGEEAKLAGEAVAAARKLDGGEFAHRGLSLDDLSGTINERARSGIGRAELIAEATAEHGIPMKPGNLAKVAGITPDEASRVIAAAETRVREASAAGIAARAVEKLTGTQRLTGPELDRALDLLFRRFDGRKEVLREAMKGLGSEDKRLMNALAKDIQDYFGTEANFMRQRMESGTRYATGFQADYLKKHPNFVRQLEDAALAKIEEAASRFNNQAAMAFVAHLKTGSFRIGVDPELPALGRYSSRTADRIAVNPFFRDAVLTGGRSQLRTIDDIASTMLHEFVHKSGHGELRAWFEQYRFLTQVGREEAIKFGAAREFKEAYQTLGKVDAMESLASEIRRVYKDRYDMEKLLRTTAWEPDTFAPIPLPERALPKARPRPTIEPAARPKPSIVRPPGKG